jgi:hypothetical protein
MSPRVLGTIEDEKDSRRRRVNRLVSVAMDEDSLDTVGIPWVSHSDFAFEGVCWRWRGKDDRVLIGASYQTWIIEKTTLDHGRLAEAEKRQTAGQLRVLTRRCDRLNDFHEDIADLIRRVARSIKEFANRAHQVRRAAIANDGELESDLGARRRIGLQENGDRPHPDFDRGRFDVDDCPTLWRHPSRLGSNCRAAAGGFHLADADRRIADVDDHEMRLGRPRYFQGPWFSTTPFDRCRLGYQFAGAEDVDAVEYSRTNPERTTMIIPEPTREAWSRMTHLPCRICGIEFAISRHLKHR